jgi:hypothetical protein
MFTAYFQFILATVERERRIESHVEFEVIVEHEMTYAENKLEKEKDT